LQHLGQTCGNIVGGFIHFSNEKDVNQHGHDRVVVDQHAAPRLQSDRDISSRNPEKEEHVEVKQLSGLVDFNVGGGGGIEYSTGVVDEDIERVTGKQFERGTTCYNGLIETSIQATFDVCAFLFRRSFFPVPMFIPRCSSVPQ